MAQAPLITFTIKLAFEGAPPAGTSATLYAFAPNGTPLGTARVEGGQASISLPEASVATARLLVGPTPQADVRHFTADYLERLHPYKPVLRLNPAQTSIEVKPIPEALWRFWLWCLCRIRGHVVKSINGVDYPVCNARVRICEIEPFWLILRRLPDADVLSLRDEVLKAVASPTLPLPPPQLEVTTPPLPPRLTPLRAQTVPPPEPANVASMLPAPALVALRSDSANAVRNALTANIAVFRPWFCFWPRWWWLFHRCEDIGTVTTDSHGRFDASHWELCGEEIDLYFWVEFELGGVWTTVYHPPVPCNIHWNYPCGSDVTIRITDPRVPACGSDPDLPGKEVVLFSFGNRYSPHQIQGAAAGASEGVTTDGRPFGGSVEPNVAFGRSALIGSGITHYRWSYRRLTTGDGSTPAVGAWSHINTPVYRHYEIHDPNPPHSPSFPTDLLGPDPAYPGKDLFRIQPLVGPGEGYVVADARADTASAFFLTDQLLPDPINAAGKYELMLELFRNGNAVNFTDEGIAVSLANIDAPFGSQTVTTIPAAGEHVFLDASNKIVALRAVLHVDNNVCHGNINDVQVTGGILGPCGFYTLPSQSAAVTVSFTASHPFNFATFDFDMARGSSGIINALSADALVNAASANGYTRSGTTFSRTYAAHDLLNLVDTGPQPGCDRGAFAEYLYIHALATDGWYILTYLDGPRGGPSEIGLKAFALAP